jgi:hypothetical protein
MKKDNRNRTKIVALIVVLVNQLAISQTYNSVTSDKEIYEFLSYIIKYEDKYKEEPRFGLKYISEKIISWKKEDFVQNASTEKTDNKYIFKEEIHMDTIFNETDKKFLMDQFNGIKSEIWYSKFKHSILTKNESDTKENRYYYSIPLFSINRKYALVKKKYYNKNHCYYGYCIYRKNEKGNWDYQFAYNCKK